MEDTLKLAKQLIKFESTKDNLSEIFRILDFCKSLLSDFSIQEFKSNGSPSLLISNQKAVKYKIILNAHLDVVSGNPDQFDAKESAGRLYGRGSIDMKGPAAAQIMVFLELAKKIKYPLALQLVTDEEIGGKDGTKHQLDQGVKAEFTIAGEVSYLKICNQAKGIIWLDAEAKGKSAHGAHVWEGDNGIIKINEFINNLKKAFPIPDQESWITTANISKINSTNSTYNKVPDHCILGVDIRYIPADSKTIIQKIKSLAVPGVDIKILSQEPHQYTSPDNPYLQKLSEVVAKITGRPTELQSDHGASDIRHFEALGMPGVCFGPIGENLHTENEWLDVKSLSVFYQSLREFLLGLNN